MKAMPANVKAKAALFKGAGQPANQGSFFNQRHLLALFEQFIGGSQAGYSASKPFAFELWYTPSHYGDPEVNMAEVLKVQLEKANMKVTIKSAEWAAYKEKWGNKEMPLYLLGWYPDYLDPDNYTWSWGHSDASDDMGIFYASDEMDSLLEAGQVAAELRGDDRLALYEEAQELWTVEVPTIPLSQGSLLVVAQPGVEGIVLDPNMLFHYFLLSK